MTDLRKALATIFMALAVIAFIGMCLVPSFYKDALASGYTEDEAINSVGLYGMICLFVSFLSFILGLGFINKWLPLLLLATWHAYKQSDDSE
ncbi:MAG: hypothetical protein PHV42_04385 [Candidatus Pacebacteria bacterium]|nr:hypothetical protein [Candidatus Paceibacterota bacterium]